MNKAYELVGRAALDAQVLELVLTPVFEFFKMHTVPGHLTKTGGYILEGAWKQPLANLVKELEKENAIDPALRDRLRAYIENRHTLIHRWALTNGVLADAAPPDDWEPLMRLAREVSAEARSLCGSFTGYMVAWTQPEWATANPDEYKQRVVEMFHKVHLHDEVRIKRMTAYAVREGFAHDPGTPPDGSGV